MATEVNQVRDASTSQISVDSEDQFIFGVAQELNKNGIWNKQLPRHEYMIVEAALKTVQTWKEFFDVNVYLDPKNKNNNTHAVSRPANKNNNSKKKRSKKGSSSSSKKRTTKKGQKKEEDSEIDNEKSNDAPTVEERTDNEKRGDEDDEGRYIEILKFRVRAIVFDHIATKHLFESQLDEHDPADDIFVTYDDMQDEDELLQDEDEDDEDLEPVPAFKVEIAGTKVPQEKKMVNANRELRSLMPDVKQSSSKKWELSTSDELKELYAGLERVLSELKNYKEHSYPFLKRVSKQEAPDYHDVITEPMDLATMTKNLHNLHYWSKDEFQSDLDLMYANCRKYNSAPEGSIYLKHAGAMEKRTGELMASVKDCDLSADKERLIDEVKKREAQREERKSDDVPNKRRNDVKQRIQFYHEHPFVTHKKTVQKETPEPDTCELPSAAELASLSERDYIALLLHDVTALQLDSAPAETEDDVHKMLQRITAQHQQLFNRTDPAIRPGKLEPVLSEQGSELAHGPVQLTDELSKQLTKQSIAVILNQNNIGGCEYQALDVLTDVLEDFMLQIGRVARSYLDMPGAHMSPLDAGVKAVSDLAGECTDGVREWLLEKKRDESRALREALIEEGSRQALHREMTPFIPFVRKSKSLLSNHHIGFFQHQQQVQQNLQQQQQHAQTQLQHLQQQQAQMQQTQGLTQHQLLQLQMQQRTRIQQQPMHPQMQGAQVKKEGMVPGPGQRFAPGTAPPDMNQHGGAPRINSFPPNLPHNPAAPSGDNALRRSAKRRKGEGGEPIPVGPTITSPDTDSRRARPARGRRSYPEEDYLDESQLRHLDAEIDKTGGHELPAHHMPNSYPPHAPAPEVMQPMGAMNYQPPPGVPGRGRGAPPMNRPVPITNPPIPQNVPMPTQASPEDDSNAKRGKRTPRGRAKK